MYILLKLAFVHDFSNCSCALLQPLKFTIVRYSKGLRFPSAILDLRGGSSVAVSVWKKRWDIHNVLAKLAHAL